MKGYVNPTTPELGDVQDERSALGPRRAQDDYRLGTYWAVPVGR